MKTVWLTLLAGAALLAFGLLADCGLSAAAERAIAESAGQRKANAELAGLAVRDALARLEAEVAPGASPALPGVRFVVLPPSPDLARTSPNDSYAAGAAPTELLGTLSSDAITENGLPAAVVAALALGEPAAMERAADRLLAGELPVEPGDLRYLARALGREDAPELDALSRAFRRAPQADSLPLLPSFRRAFDGDAEVQGWARDARGRRLGYTVPVGALLDAVDGFDSRVPGSDPPRADEVRASVAGVEGLALLVRVPEPPPWRVHGPRVALWVAVLASVAALLAVQRAVERREAMLGKERSFLAGATHELRSPLAAIRLFGQTLAAGRGEPREYGQLIDQESARLERLVEDVLAAARAGERPRYGDVDAAEIVTSVVRLVEARAARRSIALDVRVEEPVATVRWDGDGVRRALLNLADNAIQHGPAGARVELSLRREGDRVRLSVHDEGPGIRRADRRRIFGRFERAGDEASGTGLGLHLVEQVARAHRGIVELTCSEREGCTFALVLPADPEAGALRERGATA